MVVLIMHLMPVIGNPNGLSKMLIKRRISTQLTEYILT